jgi:hypothetical protein
MFFIIIYFILWRLDSNHPTTDSNASLHTDPVLNPSSPVRTYWHLHLVSLIGMYSTPPDKRGESVAELTCHYSVPPLVG